MDRKYSILVTDDEQDLLEILQFNLETEGYAVSTATSAEEALARGDLASFDLMIIDVMMGGMSGFAMARRLKDNAATARIPVIFLTARSGENDKITGFNLGADDYLTKPFSLKELSARVRAVIRRTADRETETADETVSYMGLVLNLDNKTVTVDGEPVQMTKTEFQLLGLLVANRGKVFSRGELLRKAWPKDTYVLERTVDVNITRLRKKIGPYARFLVTRLGFGYLFDA